MLRQTKRGIERERWVERENGEESVSKRDGERGK